MDRAATIVMSILIALQLLGLTYLAYYIYHVPTWTGALDAIAIARIEASLVDQDVLPPIGPVAEKDLDALRNVDGLIGLVETTDDTKGSQGKLATSNPSDYGASDIELQQVGTKGVYINMEAQSPDTQLALGASGVISSRTKNGGPV